MKHGFIFPGQGSQTVGMGRDIYESFGAARLVFEEVDEALHESLSRVIFEGPESDLTLTANAQPALMAVSLAIWRVLESEMGKAIMGQALFVAGHSLGEYSALAAAQALPIATAARLLRIRGQAMQEAVPPGQGAMAAILGLDFESVGEVVAQSSPHQSPDEVCEVANDNADSQIVISGHKETVERAVKLACERGARRAIMLPVSAPFHCSLMKPVEEVMAGALESVALKSPIVPLIANVSACAVSDPEEIRRLLVQQVTARVRWRETVCLMADQGVTGLVEVGAGRVLSGLTRRIDPSLSAFSLQAPQDLEAVMAFLT